MGMSGLNGYPVITGVGACLPGRPITNQELIDMTGINFTPGWISDRTLIETRHWVDGNQHASDLGFMAARSALVMADLTPADITSIHVATSTPDYPTPNVASLIHGRLGAPEQCLATDIRAACSGFLFGLEAASDRLRARDGLGRALVIGAELTSTCVNKSDRSTVILFGDGAGAVTLESRPGASRPISVMLTRPDLEAIYVPAGGTVQPPTAANEAATKIKMNGRAVKAHALSVMTQATRMVAAEAGLIDASGIDWSQIDYFVPHQANGRLIEAVREELGVPKEKCVVTVDRHGNTSAASLPLALATAHQEGQIGSGRKRVLLAAIAAGMVGGAMLMDADLPA
jgi:3-oxoacyl-[acyl-carrier-protein] synthase III